MGRYQNGQIVIEVADLARARVDAVIVGEETHGGQGGHGPARSGEPTPSRHAGPDGAVWVGQLPGFAASTVVWVRPPRAEGAEAGDALGRVFDAALRLALEHGAVRVALGGTLYRGAAPLSKRRQVEVAIASVVDFLEQHPVLEQVRFCLDGDDALAIHELVAEEYL